jgi:hypothetical protein
MFDVFADGAGACTENDADIVVAFATRDPILTGAATTLLAMPRF